MVDVAVTILEIGLVVESNTAASAYVLVEKVLSLLWARLDVARRRVMVTVVAAAVVVEVLVMVLCASVPPLKRIMASANARMRYTTCIIRDDDMVCQD